MKQIFRFKPLGKNIEKTVKKLKTMKWGMGFKMEPDVEFTKGKSIIHGHVITSLSEIFDAIMDQTAYIPIDNGCYRALEYAETAYGTLLALNLDTMRLIVQENIE